MDVSVVLITTVLVLLNSSLYLWWVNRAMLKVPKEASKLARKGWTVEEIRQTYRRTQENPTDVKPYLFKRRNSRYIVTGGSGLVGGWIVKHLLMRGEDPAAIRILDLQSPVRPEAQQEGVEFIKTDVSDPVAVSDAFEMAWAPMVAKYPLTVFHTVGYIQAGHRKSDTFGTFEKVNVEGTKHVLEAAQAAGASCFIATSSCAIGTRNARFFIPPWQNTIDNIFQFSKNAEPPAGNPSLKDFTGCYAYSKYLMEKLVRAADRPGFRTGALRPGSSIYGSGVKNQSSMFYALLSRGGSPTWMTHLVTSFVSAQNVSIAHLAYENVLRNDPKSSLGGGTYLCTDPGPPISYGDLYRGMITLAHPAKHVRFPPVPPVAILLACYLSEAYQTLQRRYLRFLPAATGDIPTLQPSMFQMSSTHIYFDDSRARKEIGYKPPIDTLEGLCDQMIYFNQLVEEEIEAEARKGRGEETIAKGPSTIPKPI